MIPLMRPYITDEVKSNVCRVLDSGHLTEGKVTAEFERVFSRYIRCKNSIATTSCAVGLEMALRCLAVGFGDEVIVPAFTHPATANAVRLMGARPVFADVDLKTMLIDYDLAALAITDKTKAITPVSLFGNPIDYLQFNRLKEYGISIIEDAACSIGSEYQGIKVGNLADITVFSFHPRKFITTGEGGMITTDNDDWAKWLTDYKHFGTKSTPGSNYKMSDVLAAIGLTQMGHVSLLLENRIELARNYIQLLKDHVEIPKVTDQGKHSYQTFCVLIENRDFVKDRMKDDGIEVQIGSYCLDDRCENSRYLADRCLALPLYYGLKEAEQEIIASKLIKWTTHF